MSRKKQEEDAPAGAPEWMATYGDLVTLLMCFFVLLFAMSTVDNKKFTAIMKSFQGSAGVLESGASLQQADFLFDGMPESKLTQDQESIRQRREAKALKKALEDFKKNKGKDFDFQVDIGKRGVKITFPDNVLFDPGEADIKTDANELLDYMADILSSGDFAERAVRVEGHTDNIPINTLQFPSNWELSTGRASRVVRYFTEDKGMNKLRFAPIGYGENRPVASNDTAEGRAMNRRVDIVVLTAEETEKEPDQ